MDCSIIKNPPRDQSNHRKRKTIINSLVILRKLIINSQTPPTGLISHAYNMAAEWKYPKFRRDESVREERAGGVVVSDPYRWLEDPDSEETREFVRAQNAITLPYLKECPVRDKFHER